MHVPAPEFTDNIASLFAEVIASGKRSQPVIVCDSNTRRHCLPVLKAENMPVVEIPPGEENKNLSTLESVFGAFVETGVTRENIIVNLGGGMVCDTGGFAASVYRRGIPFIHIPTTLLAMTDAAIGGKTGVDFHSLKNYIGTFSQPERILVSTEFLNTLAEDEIRSAWAEIIKTACISDAGLFEKISGGADTDEIIRGCASAKHAIAASDPLDKGLRQLLNFGHTFGHAYESLMLESGTPVRHGYAVAYGMHIELELAVSLNLIGRKEAETITELIDRKTGIPSPGNKWPEDIFRFLTADKKNRKGSISFSLPCGIGKGKFGIGLEADELKKWKKQGIL